VSRKLTWRQEIAKLVSYVRYLGDDGDGRCEAYRWSDMSLKAVHDPELREKYRCKNTARWRYRYLLWRGSEKQAKIQNMCWAHLVYAGFYGSMEEIERNDRWWRRHLDEVNVIRERHGVPPLLGEGDERHEAGTSGAVGVNRPGPARPAENE
jgi:hypothetical protein